MRFSKYAMRISQMYPRKHYACRKQLRPTSFFLKTHVNRGLFAGQIPMDSRTRRIPHLKYPCTHPVTEISGKICYNQYMCDKAYETLEMSLL